MSIISVSIFTKFLVAQNGLLWLPRHNIGKEGYLDHNIGTDPLSTFAEELYSFAAGLRTLTSENSLTCDLMQ